MVIAGPAEVVEQEYLPAQVGPAVLPDRGTVLQAPVSAVHHAQGLAALREPVLISLRAVVSPPAEAVKTG